MEGTNCNSMVLDCAQHFSKLHCKLRDIFGMQGGDVTLDCGELGDGDDEVTWRKIGGKFINTTNATSPVKLTSVFLMASIPACLVSKLAGKQMKLNTQWQYIVCHSRHSQHSHSVVIKFSISYN